MTARTAARRALVLAVLWWVLTEGRADYLLYGLLAVPLAVAASLWLTPPATGRPARAGVVQRLSGLVRLLGWYAGQTVRGALDVTRRLLRRSVDVAPVVVEVTVRLPAGPVRQAAVAMYGLMPGSLVSGTDGETFALHSLSPELESVRQWRELEDRLARAAGLHLGGEEHPE